MSSSVKKVLGIIIIVCIAILMYMTVAGIGPVKNLKDSLKYGLDINGGVWVVMEADTGSQSGEQLQKTMEQTKEVLNRRVNAMGISEATVNIEGKNRLRIEMPGVKNAKSAINRIGETAQLKFTLADGTKVLTGKDVKDAQAEADSENGGYKITMTFTSAGREKFADATEKAAAGTVTPTVKENGTTVDATCIVIWLDNKIIEAPTCSERIDSESCEITSGAGGFSKDEASETAALIRGGSLPVSLHEVSSSVESATIGANALDKSIRAGLIGLALVCILMILMYNLLGLFADIALLLYTMLVLWGMAAMGAVLTLPGIAGIVLGIGMAVDANVIIFSRIKEELGLGRSIRVAVDQGFRHALVTVLDAQITTLIATIILYELGSSTVRGFAITLMISIVVSIFTAVIVTQIFVGMLAGSPNAKKTWFECHEDGTPKKIIKKEVHFIEHRKVFYCISAAVIICGAVFLGVRGFNYGIDFTGGTMIQMDLGKKVAISDVKKTISKFDLNETIVYSGSKNKQVIIKTTKALDANERDEVQKAIEKKYGLDDDAVVNSNEFGPTIGQELRTNAIKSILLAALGMLIYIIFRFRSWKYGVAAVAGVLHDALVMVAVYAIFGITVNNPFIAAILTVVGYSINDTIVIFDRVRENSRLMRGKPVMNILNHSINQTIDRSVMTSVTTLIAIVPLLLSVSGEMVQFCFPLMIGVIVGTYSSICLCSPLYFEFNKKEELSKYQQQQKARERIERKKQEKKATAKQIAQQIPEENAEGTEAETSNAAASNTTASNGAAANKNASGARNKNGGNASRGGKKKRKNKKKKGKRR